MAIAAFIPDIYIIYFAFWSGLAEVEFSKLAIDLDKARKLDVFLIQHDNFF